MRIKFVDSTLALAFLSAVLFTLGYAFDDARLTSLHLSTTEFMPPAYLEIAKPFDLLFVTGQSDYRTFREIGLVLAVIGIVSSFWPRFRRGLVRVLLILRRIPFNVFALTVLFGILALSNWLVKYGYTTAEREIALAKVPWDDWTITLKDSRVIQGHFAAASSSNYAVITYDGSETFVQTIPRDSVVSIGHDTDIR